MGDRPVPDRDDCVARLFDAINAGERDQALSCVHPNVIWSPSAWSGASTLWGRDAVASWFDQFGPDLRDLEIEVEEIAGAAGWVVVLGTVIDSRDGGSFATRVGWNFSTEDGMVRVGRSFPAWSDARRAAGLE